MKNQKTKAQMFLEEQLKNPEVAQSFHDGFEELRLGVKIAQLREKQGLTQTQLAAKMNISASVINQIENRGKCSISTLRKVDEALDAVLQIDIAPKEKPPYSV